LHTTPSDARDQRTSDGVLLATAPFRAAIADKAGEHPVMTTLPLRRAIGNAALSYSPLAGVLPALQATFR